ncbi:MAG: sigma-70 family RNA polymerase sigma factor [Odoribacteraceae bacterium]|jgi:RNA polymerase sigma-70 factor (ECF subfamily)|nr:sigma-70 family RNA polymerase sigma factor [Odoribacteraceae bacterium]
MVNRKIEELFKGHFHAAVYIAHKIVSSRHVAEDIVQDVFIKMLEIDIDALESPAKFLYTSVHNGAIDYMRRNSRLSKSSLLPDVPDNDFPDNMVEEIEYAENLAKLLDAIEQLPGQSREVVKLVCLSDCSYNDAAARLGISLSTVKTHMYRSFKRLRDLL